MPENRTITLTAGDGHQFRTYVAVPDGAPKGGLVVIQEVFGVNRHIRTVADGYAAAGYVAVAPSLFDRVAPGIELGYGAEDIAKGRALRAQIGWDGPVRDVDAALAHAAEHGPVGTVGYCWGGSVSWLAATRLRPAAAICYYGGQIAQFKDETPRCPVQMHFGERDKVIPADDRQAIAATQPGVEIHVYPAGHGFACTERDDFDPESARIARERTLAFLARHLG